MANMEAKAFVHFLITLDEPHCSADSQIKTRQAACRSPLLGESSNSVRKLTFSMTSKRTAVLLLTMSLTIFAANPGGRAEYVGGTIAKIPTGCRGSVQVIDEDFLVFYSGKASWRVPYDKINLVEYGQRVDRRYLTAVLISPLFLLSKKRQHFLTVGYSDEEGRQQAMIFRVNKDDIRAMLVSLEARTGRKVEFQDDDARKAGKG
jgi:hypothetical protein